MMTYMMIPLLCFGELTHVLKKMKRGRNIFFFNAGSGYVGCRSSLSYWALRPLQAFWPSFIDRPNGPGPFI